MTEPGDYVLGMAPAEIERLERQHDVWRETTERIWQLAGFSTGQTIIDLGSGPGFATVDLARLVGTSGRVIAVDASAAAREQCSRLVEAHGLDNVDVVAADVTQFDASPWRADGVFARWLFSYLDEPEAVIRWLAEGLRPGATVAVMDYWNYLSIQTEPESPLFKKVYRAVYESVAETGSSFDTAGRLPALLEANGFKTAAVEVFTRVGQPGSVLWRWLDEFQRLYLPSLVLKGLLGADDVEAYLRWWEKLDVQCGALLFAPPILGVVGVKRA